MDHSGRRSMKTAARLRKVARNAEYFERWIVERTLQFWSAMTKTLPFWGLVRIKISIFSIYLKCILYLLVLCKSRTWDNTWTVSILLKGLLRSALKRTSADQPKRRIGFWVGKASNKRFVSNCSGRICHTKTVKTRTFKLALVDENN